MRDLAAYYDRLSLWTTVARAFGYGGGRGTLTVHRALADPRADGRPTATRVHDLLVDALPPLTEPRVLDAGCGMGGTMIDLATRVGGTYVGLTSVRNKPRSAAWLPSGPGTAARFKFSVESYDSLRRVHSISSSRSSRSPTHRIRNRRSAPSASLADNGAFAIVDDMPEPAAAGNANTADLATFKSGWGCPVLWDAERYRAQFADLGLRVFADLDLSPHVAPRTSNGIRQLERLNRVLHRAIPSDSWRSLMDSYHGGLALERLYRHRGMSYRMILAAADG